LKEKKIDNSKYANIPSISMRVLMTIIDWGILLAILIVFEIIPITSILVFFRAISNFNFEFFNIMKIISWIITPIFTLGAVFIIYYYVVVWPIKHNGQTFGMEFTQTKMIIITDDEKGITRPMNETDLKLNIKRFLWSILDFSFWGLVGLIAMWKNKNNQSLGEKFTKTLVISEKNK